MPNLNKFIGNLGENIAIRYLIKNEYKLIKRNYYLGFDEIDILAKEKSGILVFFEVKSLTFNSTQIFMPEDHFSLFKFKKNKRACKKFIGRYPDLINEDMGWQIDLITIQIKELKTYNLKHYRNV